MRNIVSDAENKGETTFEFDEFAGFTDKAQRTAPRKSICLPALRRFRHTSRARSPRAGHPPLEQE